MADNKELLIKLRKELDKAIDNGNIKEIDILIDKISKLDEIPIKLENPIEFANKIRGLKEKECIKMKKNIKYGKIGLIAATVAVVGCISVSGALIYNHYSFGDNDKFYRVTSNDTLNEDDLNSLKSDMQEHVPNPENVYTPEYINFNSIEEAEKQLDMKIILPEKMPELELSDIQGLETIYGENSSSDTVWITYGSTDDKCFGLTIEKRNYNGKDMTIISSSDMDENSQGEYISSKGYKFTTLNESDDTGEKTSNIATIVKDNYEYSMVFLGFSEKEMHSIIDSLSLEEY